MFRPTEQTGEKSGRRRRVADSVFQRRSRSEIIHKLSATRETKDKDRHFNNCRESVLRWLLMRLLRRPAAFVRRHKEYLR